MHCAISALQVHILPSANFLHQQRAINLCLRCAISITSYLLHTGF